MGQLTLITGKTIVPALLAGGSINIMQGTQFEYLPYHANVRICPFTRDATEGGCLATVYADTDLLLQESPIMVLATAGTLPKYPDDFHLVRDCLAGSRITITLRNTTAGTIVGGAVVHLEPIG
jgi:hypothetical protein